jgi:hypothetical protein
MRDPKVAQIGGDRARIIEREVRIQLQPICRERNASHQVTQVLERLLYPAHPPQVACFIGWAQSLIGSQAMFKR